MFIKNLTYYYLRAMRDRWGGALKGPLDQSGEWKKQFENHCPKPYNYPSVPNIYSVLVT